MKENDIINKREPDEEIAMEVAKIYTKVVLNKEEPTRLMVALLRSIIRQPHGVQNISNILKKISMRTNDVSILNRIILVNNSLLNDFKQ